MWTILKFEKKKIDFLKKDFNEKLGKDFILYQPKILIKKYQKNKLTCSEINLLGDYLFCYHKNFINPKTLSILKYCRGLKYFLEGFFSSQNDIQKFISTCKEYEDSKGFIAQNIFNIFENRKYKFLDGPFSNQIFKIINLQKSKINVLIGNLKIKIKKKDYLFYPI